MCGICGQINLRNYQADRRLIKNMASSLAHRGPDAEGFYFDGPVGLGHRRLAIIDLKDGVQPISNEDGSVILVSNSEVYNFAELKQELISKGHIFRTKTDTEAIVHLYEELGDDCLNRIEGMFAFALWDRRRRRLLLARDKIGIKPLHYYHDGRNFIFASEIKALLKYKGINKSLNYAALDQYFRFLCVIEPNTIFKHIHKLAPAHCLVLENGQVKIHKYWDIDFSSHRQINEDCWADNLQGMLKDNIEITLRSDVPVGVFLSGGIDSSVIAALASRHMRGVKSFSVIFNESMYSEEEYSKAAADKFGIKHYQLTLTANDAVKVVSDISAMLDEPFADSSCIPAYYLSKLARSHVKAVLTGEGGDELFAGYPWHMLKAGAKSAAERLLCLEGKESFNGDSLRAMYSRDLYKAINSADKPGINICAREFNRMTGLNRMLYVDLKTYLPSDILTKVDRMSMLNSLEARPPFLNPGCVSFCASIPQKLKINNGISKYILRKAFGSLLPKKIVKRSKMGFSIPLDLWIWRDGKFRNLVYDTIFSAKARKRGLFNYQAIESISRGHENAVILSGHRLWSLFMFELWQRNFLDKN